MLHYILQIVAFQLVFLIIYDVFLKRETFFNYNRLYLLGTAVLSFVLPFIKLDSIQTITPKDFVVVLPEVIIGNLDTPTELEQQIASQTGILIEEQSIPVWQTIFYVGIALALLVFLFKIIKILWLKSSNPRRWQGNILIVNLIKSSSAFSFFSTIFIGEKISNQDKPTILKHELVHVKHWHSLDLMLFEVMRILLWFNPLVYMYQNRMKALHEYIADETAVKQNGKKSYYQQLLNQVFETQNVSFTNTFFNKSLIKKRIVMLQKSKSKKVALIKYALLIPMVFGILIYTSAEVRAQTKTDETKAITETIEVQQISEKALIEKYSKELKKLRKDGDFDAIMEFPTSDLNKFTLSLDEFARLKAFMKVTKEFMESKGEKILTKPKYEDENYSSYVKRTKTEEYGRQWESKTEGSTLKLYVKDLKNQTKGEKQRLQEKIDLINKDKFWDELLISDGKESQRMTFHKENNKIVSVKDVHKESSVSNVSQSIEVPYGVIENVPTFKECESLSSNEEKKKCTSQKVAMFVNKNFNTELATKLGLSGRQRISVFFKINKEGDVTSIGARAPHPKLEEEAKRVIAMLPQFIPGTQKGKAVTVPYSLPIIFQVNAEANNSSSNTPNYDEFEKKLKEQKDKKDHIPFATVDKVPTYDECKNLASKIELKKCTAKQIAIFVNKNFNLDLAKKLGLKGRQKIAVVFIIGKDGAVHSASARAPHPKLEEEAVRVVSALPIFIPGEHKGEKVDVIYKLPILFQVQE